MTETLAPPAREREIALARWARETAPSALQTMLSLSARPGILSLGLGLPAPELFPAAGLTEAAARVLADDPVALQYSPPFAPLKRHVVALMERRGVRCTEEQVFLTAGGQQGMSLLVRLLLDPGGTVLLERLCYTGLRQAVEPFRPRVLSVPTDPDTGIDVDAVEAHLAAGERPAFLYVVTDGNNPLSVSVSVEKRRRLVELAREHGVPILEDDAYGYFQYVDDPLPPLRALDDRWVLYVGTFSKIFAPALRAGWLVVPGELVPRLGIVKEASDINTSTFTHRVISSYIDQGLLPAHLDLLRREYGVRRDAMLDALAEHFPAAARWRAPSAGVFVWVELPAGLDAGALLREAVESEQVAFLPGHAFAHGGDTFGSNCVRLNFSHSSPERIREGVARLGRVLRRDRGGAPRRGSPGCGRSAARTASPGVTDTLETHRPTPAERFPIEQLREFSARVFRACGVPDDDAALAADVLALADLQGIDSHGVARLPQYFEMFELGRINPRPELRMVRESPSTATVDGDNGLGLVVGPKANRLAMEKAEAVGTGWVAVRNSNHFGAGAYYPLQGLDRELIVWAMTNSPPQVAPLWGAEKMLGTNPMAIAFPALEEPPVVIDFTASAISFGKVESAARRGEPIPQGCAIDRHGRMTTDPGEMLDGGALLPLGGDRERGGHKGYCLAALVDLLSAALPGANWGPFPPPFPAHLPAPARSVGLGVGHLFGAFRISAFIDPLEFRRQVDDWVRTMRSTRPAEGTGGPMIPGDSNRRAEEQRRHHGVPVIRPVAEALERVAARAGVPFG